MSPKPFIWIKHGPNSGPEWLCFPLNGSQVLIPYHWGVICGAQCMPHTYRPHCTKKDTALHNLKERVSWFFPALLFTHRLNMELDLQSLFGLHVHSCTHRLRPRIPPPRIWARIPGRYWSAKIDDISLWPPIVTQEDGIIFPILYLSYLFAKSWEELIFEKNCWSKLLWHFPFKGIRNVGESGV